MVVAQRRRQKTNPHTSQPLRTHSQNSGETGATYTFEKINRKLRAREMSPPTAPPAKKLGVEFILFLHCLYGISCFEL